MGREEEQLEVKCTLNLIVWEQLLSSMQERRGSDLYPIISQPTNSGRRVKQQQLKSKFLLFNVYLFLSQFQNKRARFPLVFITYFIFCTKIVVPF